MNLSAVISQLISLFLMMIIGYAAARTGLITPDFRKKLSAFTLGTAAPCIILSSALESSGGMNVPVTLGTAALFYVVMIALAKVFVLVMRTPASQRKLDELMLIYTNVGFMGIPVVQSIYGATGVAMVSMFILMFNLTFFSYGIMLISGGTKINLRALINPCIFAALGAMVLSFTGLRLPAVVESAISSVGAINTPMAMMIIGASLAHSDLHAALINMRLYRVSTVSMLVMPLCVLALSLLLPVEPMLRGVAVCMAAMPIAGNCAMASDMYTPEDMTASHAVIVSTLMSAVTLPLICAVMSFVL
ncbi:MAG: AEC family transporter [Clostridia bacterium]|nr:AEC family transporter [Clostridia bacterium]